MEYVLDAASAKWIDTHTIEEIGMPSLLLMERAALAVAEEAAELCKNHASDRIGAGPGEMSRMPGTILAICGSGNNGGDGIAAARILHCRGYRTAVMLAGDPDRMTGDCRRQLTLARSLGVPVGTAYSMEEADVIIDALFGIGLSRDIEGRYADLIHRINHSRAQVLAVDIASGISADNGQILGCAVKADVTVTFGYKKAGHLLYPGASCTGRLVCAEIGFDPGAVRQLSRVYSIYDDGDLKRLPERVPDSHKGTYGKVLIIAGSRNMAGAAYLSGLAAYRTGSGLVTLFTPECNRIILQQLLPEAVMKTYDETDEPGMLAQLGNQLKAADVVVLGPGLGKAPYAQTLTRQVIADCRGPLIADADALNILSEHMAWLDGHQQPLIMTPHLKELSRLTGQSVQYLKENLVQVCEAFTRKFSVICISKDVRTMIFDHSGNIYINVSGNNGMSAGGSGDVLTGVLAGLIAQGMEPEKAARLGVYLHGRAGDAAAGARGVYSMTASDLAEGISAVLKNFS